MTPITRVLRPLPRSPFHARARPLPKPRPNKAAAEPARPPLRKTGSLLPRPFSPDARPAPKRHPSRAEATAALQNSVDMGRWCPGADLNYRHADFQAKIFPEKSAPSEVPACQNANGGSRAYGQIVKPVEAPKDPPENESSGLLAGRTGAKEEGLKPRAEEYGLRLERATALWRAFERCHAQDAAMLIRAAFDQLGAGTPRPTIRRVMTEAREWVEEATPYELKAYASVCAEAMAPELRAKFIGYLVDRYGAPCPAGEARNAA